MLGQDTATRRKGNNREYAYEEALDLISDGLEILAQPMNQKALDKLGGKRLIDYGARINAQVLALEKLLKPAKDKIKADAVENHKEEISGVLYKAVIKRFEKGYWKFADLTKFLGTKKDHFIEVRDELQVQFEVKE